MSNIAPDAHARTTATDDGIHDFVVCGVVGVQLTIYVVVVVVVVLDNHSSSWVIVALPLFLVWQLKRYSVV